MTKLRNNQCINCIDSYVISQFDFKNNLIHYECTECNLAWRVLYVINPDYTEHTLEIPVTTEVKFKEYSCLDRMKMKWD